MTAWNPADLEKMALPPMSYVFASFMYRMENCLVKCMQRSADMGLGVPFNIASYALLTRLIAQVCSLKPGEFVHILGDTHVYSNHVEPLKTQLQRKPKPFPLLKINPEKKEIDSFQFSDFKIIGYEPYPTIKMEMAV